MSRSRSSYYKMTDPESQFTTLKDHSISVFRQVGQTALNSVIESFQNGCQGLFVIPRASGDQKGHALSIVQMAELSRNKNFLGAIGLKNAVDIIYSDIPSLRKRMSIKTAEVSIFGNHHNPIRPVCITFDQESSTMLMTEREQILSTIEELSGFDESNFRWVKNLVPHVSLGKINLGEARSEDRVNYILETIKDSLPDQIEIQRATIHSPQVY